MIAGAGPTGKKHDGQYWRELPPFLHNVKVNESRSSTSSSRTDSFAGNVSVRYLRYLGSW